MKSLQSGFVTHSEPVVQPPWTAEACCQGAGILLHGAPQLDDPSISFWAVHGGAMVECGGGCHGSPHLFLAILLRHGRIAARVARPCFLDESFIWPQKAGV
jgi:hypothetical protein